MRSKIARVVSVVISTEIQVEYRRRDSARPRLETSRRASCNHRVGSVGKQKPGIKKAQVGQPRLRAQLSIYHFAV